MPKFACSVAACLRSDGSSQIRHGVFLVTATSHDEALGVAVSIARKLYPAWEGWEDQDAVVCSDDNVLTPETAIITGSDS